MPPTPEPPFIPLAPAALAAGPRADLRLHLVAPPCDSAPFQSVAQSLPAAHGEHGQPGVSVERKNGRISTIRVRCACGQIFELECLYETPPAAPGGPDPIPATPAS